MEKCVVDAVRPERRRQRGIVSTILFILDLIWGLTKSDFATFVIPNTTFGILGALAGSHLADGQLPSPLQVAQRLPTVILFNWSNLLIFDIANQRSDESVKEDLINKPWRPIPSGKVTGEQMRRSMLALVPIVLAINYYMGVWREGVFIHILTWLYNDLKGGDEVVRNPIISVAYGFFNHASLQIALGGQAEVNLGGLTWILIISGVILTTMHVQDLKDQEGDRTRGRLSIPFLLGDLEARISIAGFVLCWSCICTYFWRLGPWAYAPILMVGGTVAMSAILRRTPKEDAQTWKMWCFWTMNLYALPMFGAMLTKPLMM